MSSLPVPHRSILACHPVATTCPCTTVMTSHNRFGTHTDTDNKIIIFSLRCIFPPTPSNLDRSTFTPQGSVGSLESVARQFQDRQVIGRQYDPYHLPTGSGGYRGNNEQNTTLTAFQLGVGDIGVIMNKIRPLPPSNWEWGGGIGVIMNKIRPLPPSQTPWVKQQASSYCSPLTLNCRQCTGQLLDRGRPQPRQGGKQHRQLPAPLPHPQLLRGNRATAPCRQLRGAEQE